MSTNLDALGASSLYIYARPLGRPVQFYLFLPFFHFTVQTLIVFSLSSSGSLYLHPSVAAADVLLGFGLIRSKNRACQCSLALSRFSFSFRCRCSIHLLAWDATSIFSWNKAAVTWRQSLRLSLSSWSITSTHSFKMFDFHWVSITHFPTFRTSGFCRTFENRWYSPVSPCRK